MVFRFPHQPALAVRYGLGVVNSSHLTRAFQQILRVIHLPEAACSCMVSFDID